MRTISNQKYEITDMTHEEYPFLHRIRALRDICGEIRAGDLGGFVESESNLSAESGAVSYTHLVYDGGTDGKRAARRCCPYQRGCQKNY